MWLGAGFPYLPLQQWSCAGTWGCVVSARHGTAGQPQGFGGLMLIFKIGFLKLVVKHSTSPLSNNNTLKKRNTQRSWIRCVEIRSSVLLVYLFSNTGLIHTTGWCCLSTLSFQLPHTHTHPLTRWFVFLHFLPVWWAARRVWWGRSPVGMNLFPCPEHHLGNHRDWWILLSALQWHWWLSGPL